MATTIVFDAMDIFDLGRQMTLAQPVVIAESTVAMTRSAILVQNAAKQNIQAQQAIDTGQLLNSIAYARPVQPFSARIGSNVIHARPVEDGRRPGAPMPPAGALLGWMNRHGIPAAFEFVIRRAIARRGVRARPYLVPAVEQNRNAINREWQAALRRITAKVMA